MEVLYNKNNETIYFKWGFLSGVGLAVLGFIIISIFNLLFSEKLPEYQTFIIFTFLKMYFVSIIVYPFVLYFVLKKVNSLISNMNKYVVAFHTLAGIWITSIIVWSLINKSFILYKMPLLPIAITFLVPWLYKIKNSNIFAPKPKKIGMSLTLSMVILLSFIISNYYCTAKYWFITCQGKIYQLIFITIYPFHLREFFSFRGNEIFMLGVILTEFVLNFIVSLLISYIFISLISYRLKK